MSQKLELNSNRIHQEVLEKTSPTTTTFVATPAAQCLPWSLYSVHATLCLWQCFGRFSDFLEVFQIFGKFSDFWKIFRFLEDFQIFGRFSGFWTIPGILTFETLFTILTIENLNS